MGGLDPACCVYIGDSPSDGTAAENAGMAAIGVCGDPILKKKCGLLRLIMSVNSIESLRALLPQIITSALG
jgi:beta-phosphoglucomutase-like phosphatase (HAD superfamily)